jgi:nucleotide-binding universal stress UspA family protein
MNTSTSDTTELDPDLTVVIVGVDGSEAADAAARAAAVEAIARGVPLVIVRAFDWPAGGVDGLPIGLDGRAIAHRSAARELAQLADWISHRLPLSDVRTELVDGPPVDVLCARSARAVLLVVGAHGRTWSTGDVLGSVASGVVHRSACPVLLHRSTNPLDTRGSDVTVGVDGGPGSRGVLTAAAAEARRRGVPLTVVHTWRQLTDDAARPLRWLLDREATDASETDVVEGLVTELRFADPELQLDVQLLPGLAGPALVEAGDGAGLLVIGRPATPGGRGLRATTYEVSSRSRVPVLMVPLPVADGIHADADQQPLAGRV